MISDVKSFHNPTQPTVASSSNNILKSGISNINSVSNERLSPPVSVSTVCSNTDMSDAIGFKDSIETSPSPLSGNKIKLSNKEIATRVSQRVRIAYKEGWGSDNIKSIKYRSYFNDTAYEYRRQQAAIVRKALQELTSENVNKHQQKDLGELKIDAGNCIHLATTAVREANKLGANSEVWAFTLAGKENRHILPHCFALVGTPKEASLINFDHCQGIWVIDPWANIVCEAPEYLRQLNEKMERWEIKGKMIYNYETDKWESPIDDDWIKSINESPKKFHLTYSDEEVQYQITHAPPEMLKKLNIR